MTSLNLHYLLQLVGFCSVTQSCPTPWTVACQASLSITNSQSLLRLKSIELMMPSNHFILCHPLLLLPSVFPSIRVFSNELAFRIRWPKYWSFSFSMSPSNEYPGLISFKTDWFDLFAAWGTLESQAIRHARLVPLSVRLFSSALQIVSRELTCQPGGRPVLKEGVGGCDLWIPSGVWGLNTGAEEHILKKEPKDGLLRRKFCLFQRQVRTSRGELGEVMLQALVNRSQQWELRSKGAQCASEKGGFLFPGAVKGGNLILQTSLELSPSQVACETSECFFSSLFCLPYDYFLKSVSCYERDKSYKQILFSSRAVAPASVPSLNQEEPSGSCAPVSLSPATRWRHT